MNEEIIVSKQEYLDLVKLCFTDYLKQIFNSQGIHYKVRDSQLDMSLTYASQLYDNNHSFIEAPTGTGKSLAYLIPQCVAVTLGIKSKFLIATHTINLQYQLVNKDLPIISQIGKLLANHLQRIKYKGIIKREISYKLLMSRTNYSCANAIEKFYEKNEISTEEYDILRSKQTMIDYNNAKDIELFYKFGSCNNCSLSKCPFKDECAYAKTKNETDFTITNHAYLATSIVYNPMLDLSFYNGLTIDECHNFYNVLLDAAHYEINYNTLINLPLKITKAIGEMQEEYKGNKFDEMFNNIKTYNNLVSSKLESCKMFENIVKMFDPIKLKKREIQQVSIKKTNINMYKKEIDDVIANLYDLYLYNATLYDNIKNSKQNGLIDLVATQEFINYFTKIEKFIGIFLFLFYHNQNIPNKYTRFVNQKLKPNNNVSWFESSFNNNKLELTLHCKPMFVDKKYVNSLLESSLLFTSATYFSNDNSEFFRTNMNLIDSIQPNNYIEKSFLSPFNYKDNVQSFYFSYDPFDTPSDTSWRYHLIYNLMNLSNGGMLILCTSNVKMKEYYNTLSKIVEKYDIDVQLVAQFNQTKQELTDLMKNNNNVVLIGVDSFWEGFDIQGHNLRIVLIDQLPFENPSDVYVSERNDIYKASGKNPFVDYSIPYMTTKMKQGMGRLLRSELDKGLIFILDERLDNKPYGQKFINHTKYYNYNKVVISGANKFNTNFEKYNEYLKKQEE